MFRFAGYSDIGGREKNEDAFCMEEKAGCYLFAVADGLGGYDNGEIASALTIAVLRKRFLDDPSGLSLEEAIIEANRSIFEKQRELGGMMKTTVSAVYVSREKTTVANVGDSRTYLFHGADIVFQTTDHSAAQLSVSMGEISPAQIRGHEDRNILTRAIGVSETLRIDIVQLDTDWFDGILVCSDGFWENVVENEMCGAILSSKDPENWLRGMREYLARRITDDSDNNTAVTAVKEGMTK